MYAAALAAKLPPGATLEAVGGRKLRALNVRMVADCSKWGALGILEALKVLPRVWWGFQAAKRALAKGEPGVFVPIDFGYMNVKLARYAKQRGWKVLYFVPPGSWRRDKQGRDLPEITDQIVTPFPWSAKLLQEAGANAHFLGHPLLEMIASAGEPPERGGEVALLPGSRKHEIEHNLPVLAAAVARLGVTHVAFAVASSLAPGELERLWAKHAPTGVTARFESDRYQVMRSCRAGILCSGTATLEAALCGLPHVVVYRGSKWMELEFKIRKPKFDFISQPNILLGRGLLTELIQDDASPDRVAEELRPLLEDSARRQEQLEAFEKLRLELLPDNAITETANLIQKLGQP